MTACASDVDTIVLRAHATAPQPPSAAHAPAITRRTLATAALATAALPTRHYGRDELALVSSLRAAAAQALPAMPRARARSLVRRRTALAAAALGAAAAGMIAAEFAFQHAHPPRERAAADPATASTATRPAPSAPAPSAPPTARAQHALPASGAGVPASTAAPAGAGPAPQPAQVIELLARGRYPAALAGYEQLARSDPNNRAYAVAAAVLRAKLRARCASSGSEGAACAAAQP